MRGLFVLHPHLSCLKPDSVVSVCAAPYNHRQFPRLASFAAAYFKRPAAFPTQPALRSGDEQVQGKSLLVREKDVVVVVFIDIPATQINVPALRVPPGGLGSH